MTRIDTRRTIALLAAAAATLLFGCTEPPEKGTFENPLDPMGPQGGDPFELQAVVSGHEVLVTWTGQSQGDLAGYQILRTHSADGIFAWLADVAATAVSYRDSSYAPNRENWYKILALDGEGAVTDESLVTAAMVLPPAQVTFPVGASTPSRIVDVEAVTAVGDRIEIDLDPAFPDPVSLDFDEEGLAAGTLDIGAADATGEWRYIHSRVFTGEAVSAVRLDSLRVNFAPALQFASSGGTVASRTTPLMVGGSGGVVRMRFAVDRPGLEGAAWLDGATTYEGWELTAEADSQLVYGEFECDFGFTAVDSAWAAPDSLLGLELVLNGGVEPVSGGFIPVDIAATATHIRAAGSPEDLASTAWQPYGDAVTFAHDGCDSPLEKTVWAQVRNDWFTADPISATATWAPPEVLGTSVSLADTIHAGLETVISGTTVRGTCSDPVDLVELSWVEDEWHAAVGTAGWTFAWTAPAEPGEVSMTVRVTAGEETAELTFGVPVE